MPQTTEKLSEAGSLTDLLTVKEVSALTRFAIGTIYNKIHRGDLVPTKYAGIKPLISRASALALLKDHRERAPRNRSASNGA